MRRIIICFLMLAPIIGMAQIPIRHFNDNSFSHLANNIIRTDRMAYYEDEGVGYFSYLKDDPSNYSRVKVPDNWLVRDFRVLGNKVLKK